MKRLAYIFVAAVALGAISCNKNSLEEEQARQEAEKQERISSYWSVVGKLVSAADRTDDYAEKSFEPVIGIEDPSDSQTRIVSTNTLESARERFANLIGVDVNEIGTAYTFKDDEIGTLVYSEGGNSLATVEVNIRQIPHLSRIRYATPEQKGENGKFDGAAYYRFGDVISVENSEGRNEYWVCVRPAFGKEGKETTHWITVSPVTKKNVLNYSSAKSSNKREYNIQDDLKYDTEHMQNLAELLFAICFPSQWHDNITDIPSMKMFHDMDKENIRFHNEAFWQNVQNYWEEFNVSEQVFGKPLSYFASSLQSDGLYLLYDESSWNTWFYNGPTVHQAHYSNTKGTVKANMHMAEYSKVQHDVINKKDPSQDLDYNVLTECTLDHPYLVKPGFFGDSNPRWIIRYAEGCELSSTGKYGDNDIRSKIPGALDVYRYYRDVNETNDLANSDLFPEVTPSTDGTPGASYFHAGDIIQRNSDGTYWICVRPAGGPQYREQSYWVCLHPFNKSGKTIIQTEKKTIHTYFTNDRERTYVEYEDDFIYAKDLMSLETAKAAHLVFSSLVYPKAWDLLPNAERTYNDLKDLGFDLLNVHAYCMESPSGVYSEFYERKEGFFVFAYDGPVTDDQRKPLATSYVEIDDDPEQVAYFDYVQPVMVGRCNEIINGKLQQDLANRQNSQFKRQLISLLLSPVNDYDELWMRNFTLAVYNYYKKTMNEGKGYDFKDYLHHFSNGKLSYQNDEFQMVHDFDGRQVFFSPELVILDNKTENGRVVSPVSSSDYKEIYLGGAMHAFDYWDAVKKFERTFQGEKEGIL